MEGGRGLPQQQGKDGCGARRQGKEGGNTRQRGGGGGAWQVAAGLVRSREGARGGEGAREKKKKTKRFT